MVLISFIFWIFFIKNTNANQKVNQLKVDLLEGIEEKNHLVVELRVTQDQLLLVCTLINTLEDTQNNAPKDGWTK